MNAEVLGEWKEIYLDLCRICKECTYHCDFTTPTNDNPYEITSACIQCLQKEQEEQNDSEFC